MKFSDDYRFVVSIPCSASSPPTSSSQLLQDLDSIFTTSDQSKVEDEDWSAVHTPSTPTSDLDHSQAILTPSSSFSLPSRFPAGSQADPPTKLTSLPTLASLSRPDLLFQHSTPYIIHVRHERNRQWNSHPSGGSTIQLPDRIIIQSTHEPSLKLMHDYFSKWTRSDPQTREKIPVMRHTLSPSCLVPGTSYDTLIIEPFSQVSARSGSVLNTALYLAFIESMLGYELSSRGSANGNSGEFWELRRMTAFV